MEKKVLVLMDSDPRYLERFRDSVEKRKNFPFPVAGYTHFPEDGTKLTERAAVLLVEERLWQGLGEEEQRAVCAAGRPLFLLRSGTQETGEIPSIYKYQALEQILEEIRSRMEGDVSIPSEGETGAEFLAVYAPSGGSYRTTCALVLGQILAEEKPVLYVSLEAFSGLDFLPEGGRGQSLSDALYLWRMSGGEKCPDPETAGSLGPLRILPPVRNPEDIWETPAEETAAMLTKMGEEGRYGAVILDMDSGKNPIPLLRLCRRILMPVRGDALSVRKISALKTYLNRQGEEEILAAVQEVRVPECSALREAEPDYRQLRYGVLGQFWEKEAASW